MAHQIYFPEDGTGERGPVGYDVRDVTPVEPDGDLERVSVTFEDDGTTEVVPAAHVLECSDPACVR
jgi:hypothetical protein